MLPNDIYLWDSAMFHLDLYDLQASAQCGSPASCYALARYLCAVRPEVDSVEFAIELLYRAADAGVADATAALALLWRSGDMGLVDYEKYQQMITEAYEKGSLLAAKEVLTDMICGYGVEQNIGRALEIIDERMVQDNSSLWCYLKGLAIHKSADMLNWKTVYPKATEWYRQAADDGISEAYDGLVDVCTKDYFGKIIDNDKRIDIITEAALKDHGKYMCELALIDYNFSINNPDQCDENWKRDNRIFFTTALDWGSAVAAYYLGALHYNHPKDLDTAWAYYTKGAILGSPECYEAMYDLMDNGSVAETEQFRMQTALRGTRCGSLRLLRVVIELYNAGHLQAFTSEIENYYIPRLKYLEDFERGEIAI